MAPDDAKAGGTSEEPAVIRASPAAAAAEPSLATGMIGASELAPSANFAWVFERRQVSVDPGIESPRRNCGRLCNTREAEEESALDERVRKGDFSDVVPLASLGDSGWKNSLLLSRTGVPRPVA